MDGFWPAARSTPVLSRVTRAMFSIASRTSGCCWMRWKSGACSEANFSLAKGSCSGSFASTRAVEVRPRTCEVGNRRETG